MCLGLIYEMGAMILGVQHQDVGDTDLLQVFGTMLYSEPWGFPTTDELFQLLNRTTGKDWYPWFERCCYGMALS